VPRTAEHPAAEATASPRPLPAQGAAEGDSPLHVLLVEDGVDYALLVEEMLREAFDREVELSYRSRLSGAREVLRAGGVDCVLLDLNLPDASGLEALENVQHEAPEVPVVILSGDELEETAVQAVHEGAQDYLVKRRATADVVARAIRYAIERKQGELELEKQALHDALTGLANRVLFMDRLEVALAHKERTRQLVAVIFMDLDRFKLINDSLGHDAGDHLLREVAARICDLVRPSDTVARFGGDEFMVLCDDLDSESQALVVAERLSRGLSEPFHFQEREIFTGASLGVAFGHDRGTTPDSLVCEADQAMYRAKQQGFRYEVFARRSGRAPAERLSLDSELHRALERGELSLHYQPLHDLDQGTVFAVEALLRWEHPDRGLLSADAFVPVAEETGLIASLGEWAIAQACGQLMLWREAGLCSSDLAMSVNLSLRELADPRLAGSIRQALDAAGVPPESLLLEITESVVAADAEAAALRLRELKAVGVRLSLDDFGTGLSSLSAVQGYPLDMLKLDRSFVGGVGEGERAERMLAAVVEVAHAAGLRAVAEGVERTEQLDAVIRSGCDAAQGFLLGGPGAPDTVVSALERT
jgi:diguanylate cyclase (GGDEF)-like protein